uniref:Glutamate receptor n=1 Tax=Nelumbo nucifera TaxID=4432 RepID=A0A822Y7S0_NELNU|nr:TPA_asm: hypothetical protein HUJ06_029089 [Nelumbo nucifera]
MLNPPAQAQAQLLSLLFCICCLSTLVTARYGDSESKASIPIGVILDLNSTVGEMAETCIRMALSDFYAAHTDYRTRLVLHTRDSNEDVVAAASAALDLLKNDNVQAIIGPQKSAQARFVIDLGDKAQVPIISFSATSPSLSPIQNHFFVRTTQDDSSQVKAIKSIFQNYGWKEVVPIYEDTDYGNGVIPYLIDAFQEIEVRVPYRSVIPLYANDDQILEELNLLMTMQTRVFVVHMTASLGSRFFAKVKQAEMMSEGFVWMTTDGLSSLLDPMDPTVIDSMQGVLGLKPYIPKSKNLHDFKIRWEKEFSLNKPNRKIGELSLFGLWAYDTVWALAMATERVGAMNTSFIKTESSEHSTDLATLGYSQMGPKLLQKILATRFRGLGGKFNLVKGKLQPSTFQIFNVIGKGERVIGYWSVEKGLHRDLKGKSKSNSVNNLSTPIWPGDSTITPKGWVIPTKGKRLKIGVPVKDGFSEFVKVTNDTTTNAKSFDGFSIDVFRTIINRLPFAVPCDLFPYMKPNGQSIGSYDELLYQVYLKKYDAVVGDTTIVANRSLYVDFTLPYSESGVSMVVPIRDETSQNAWIFLKPLSWELWLMTGAAFIFTGFVVWILEHRINSDFRGPPTQQVGIIFWFSFSTLVFAHREKIVNNLSRFVLIIWVFVVLILAQSYTASLTSMLTVQQLKPTLTDINELRKNGFYVGYQKDSFVKGLLIKRLNLDEDKLRAYSTPEEYHEALSKGTQNGGVAAIIDEIPYIKLFLAKYCSKYIMVGPTYKTDGFGFAFPAGSPLVPYISRAILNLTEGDEMETIERKWFQYQTKCQDQSTEVSSNSASLSLRSFWGLFLITGLASICFTYTIPSWISL